MRNIFPIQAIKLNKMTIGIIAGVLVSVLFVVFVISLNNRPEDSTVDNNGEEVSINVSEVSDEEMSDETAVKVPAASEGTIAATDGNAGDETSVSAGESLDANSSDVNSLDANSLDANSSGENASDANVSETGDADKPDNVGGIPYSKLAMANVHEAVNVRADADENSELLGKLYTECGGEILEQKNGWTKIKTGELMGWVKNDYLLFGEDARKLADSVVLKTATSTAETLRVRKEPSESATILSLLAKGDEIEATEELGDWVKVAYSDGTEGYVAARYVSISYEVGKGETMAAIEAREAAEKAEKEAVASAGAKEGQSAEEAAAAASTVPVTVTNNGAIEGTVDDVRLLAALIQCEAGYEIYEGQVAVGSVVMNRLRSGRYGNTIYGVIYAKSQFSPAGSGMVAKVYAQGPKESCIRAAQEAMSGVSYVGNATKFRNIRSGYTGIVIGNHVFW